MKRYKVLTSIRYAARIWNPGEEVDMPDDRAEKYLNKKTIKAIEEEEEQLSAPSEDLPLSEEPTLNLDLALDEEIEQVPTQNPIAPVVAKEDEA